MRGARASGLATILALASACGGASDVAREARDAEPRGPTADASDEGGVVAEAERDAARGPGPFADAGADQDAGDAGNADDARAPEVPWDPGPLPWERVPEHQVLETCRLDPAALAAADAALNTPWAVIRYGKLCHQFKAEGMAPRNAWSVTKTLGALVMGMVAYETRALPKPLSDEDRVDHWLDTFSYNPEARIAHVLAMIAHNESLAYGERTMEYDTFGTVQIDSLSTIMNLALAQDGARLGDLAQFTQWFLFDKLGMAHSAWPSDTAEKPLGFGWSTDVFDMAKLGQLMLRGGEWNGERLLSSEWVYRMTHPSFEDANTGYGYLTWLNASAGWTIGVSSLLGEEALPELPGVGAVNPGPCAPVALHEHYPHGLSTAPDCLYGAVRDCEQQYDVGVWQAVGLLGQVIQGHRGLDMVVVGMDLTKDEGVTEDLRNVTSPSAKLWDALRPAVILGDPTYAGDEAAFCAAYGNNAYAPDLVPWE